MARVASRSGRWDSPSSCAPLADTSTGGGRDLAWLSFLGWAEKVSPFGENRLWLLLPAVAATAVLLVVADVLLHRRDLGSGLWAARPGPAHASARLGTPLGLAWRLQRGSLLGWTIGYAVVGLAVGNIAKSVDQIASSPDVEEMLRKMSGGQGTLLDVFFGTELRFLAIGVAAYGIATALRLRSEESAGRAEIVLATPVSRWQWLGSHALIAALGSLWLLAVVGVGAGLSAGAVSSTGVGDLLPAALATAPAVLVCVALTVLLFGLLPRWSTFAWGLLAVFVLLGELGALLSLPDWAHGPLAVRPPRQPAGGDANAAGLVRSSWSPWRSARPGSPRSDAATSSPEHVTRAARTSDNSLRVCCRICRARTRRILQRLARGAGQRRSVRPSDRSASTTALTSWARSRDITRSASGVSTTTTSSRPTSATTRPVPGTTMPVESTTRTAEASPRTRTPGIPSASVSSAPSEPKSPTSSQPKPPGTTATRPCGRRGLGDGVVDRDLLEPGPHLVEPTGVGRERPQPRRELGVPLREQVEQDGRLHHEHPGVPAEPARREVLLGARPVGLLDELGRRPAPARRRAASPSRRSRIPLRDRWVRCRS